MDYIGHQVVGGSLLVLGLHLRCRGAEVQRSRCRGAGAEVQVQVHLLSEQVSKLDALDREVHDGRILLHKEGVLSEPEEEEKRRGGEEERRRGGEER